MKHSILYFDDDPRQLEVFQKLFGDEYEVRTATSHAEARRMLADCSAEIIICDQSMPEIRGTEFLRHAAALCPGSFRVLLTGTTVVGQVIREVSTGVIHLFVRKPWTEEYMRQVLERADVALEQRHTGRREGLDRE